MSEPVRVLNLFTNMNRGGAETMVMNYFREIDRSKVTFDFMVHRQERGEYDDEIEALGGRIFRMCPIYPQNIMTYQKMLRSFFDEHNEYKIVHSHMSELGYYALKEAKKHGVPVRICHAHNAPVGFDSKIIFRDGLKQLIKPYTTHEFTCSEPAGEWLFGKKNKDKFIQMNNAIDAGRFRYDENTRNEVRREFGIESDALVIGHVGRFDTQKNHKFLIEIFREIKKIKPESVLILAGGGSLEESVRSRVKELGLESSVIFAGVRGDIDRLLQGLDVFLFPSLFEGLSVVLIEVQASGTPCLTSTAVSRQTEITYMIEFFPLSQGAQQWAQKAVELARRGKKDTYCDIAGSGYDVKTSARWLESFYLDEYNKYNEGGK